MPDTAPLTHRERVQLALAHRQPDRVPMALICAMINRPARTALEEHLRRDRGIGVDEFLEPFLDVRVLAPHYIGPPLPAGTDIWGVHRSPLSYGADSYDEIDGYPLAGVRDIAELHRRTWPRTEWFDYAELAAQVVAAHRDGYAVCLWGSGNVFEATWYMRGFEQAFVDMVENPELLLAISERVCAFYCAHYRRLLEATGPGVELCFTADDIGGQEGLLVSRPMWERHMRPFLARLCDVIHGFGSRVIYHSDGAVMEAVPWLAEAGIDVLQALQFDARGMDPARLKREFGARLSFQGGVSVQRTLPFGAPADVRAEVEHLVCTLGRGGGYILGPAHSIQAGTPPENVVAMFETAAVVR